MAKAALKRPPESRKPMEETPLKELCRVNSSTRVGPSVIVGQRREGCQRLRILPAAEG